MYKYLLIVLFTIGAVHGQTKMNNSEANNLRSLVKAKAAKTQTITCDFVQYKHLDFLSNAIKSTGKLAFKAPNMVSWQYISPFSYTVLFKEEKLFINDDGNKSNMDLSSNTIFTQLNQLITASISGDMFISETFDMDYFKVDEKSLVHFTPKDPQFSEFIKVFHILFSDTGEVLEVKMIEPSNDYTHIIFSNRVENQTIPHEVFTH
ncbi:outer membrane lipoprotein carrier protein LolA [Maribacter sp. CXY002]|uniref:outer membrane lipoprotein carrier protein LolA n=1 Tax=Maribacter luteocoastalis TaxID=3407671 RepID=UPI003B685926